MVLKLYVDHISQPARALMLFVRANKIPTEEILVALGTGEQKGEEFSRVNRFQKIPAIVHNDFHLGESVAIFQYLCREFKELVPDHWYPQGDSRKRARVDEYMAWQHIGLRLPILQYFRVHNRPERLVPMLPTPELKSQYKQILNTSLDLFEKLWLGQPDQDFVVGNQISIADLLAATELETACTVAMDLRDGSRPRIGDYLNRVKSALDPHYDPVHSALYKEGKIWSSKIVI